MRNGADKIHRLPAMAHVARTLPFNPRARGKPKPDKPLPSITEEVQRQIEADQKDIKKQLKHA